MNIYTRTFLLTVCAVVVISVFVVFHVETPSILNAPTFYQYGTHLRQVENEAPMTKKNVSILCFISTYPDGLRKTGVHVRNTWAKRCDKFLFMSDTDVDAVVPVVNLNTQKGYEHLNSKSREAMDYVIKHHLHDFDWFLKTDDDAYVIMENLRDFLSDKDPDEPVYFGELYRTRYSKKIYPSGGSGYILSRAAMEAFGNRPRSLCALDNVDGGSDDVYVSDCLRSLSVRAGESLDDMNRLKLHHFSPQAYLTGEYPNWYRNRTLYPITEGLNNLTRQPISFHKLDAATIDLLEYLLYYVDKT